MKKRTIILVGARIDGQAGAVINAIKEIGGYDIVGFIDSTLDVQRRVLSGVPVIGRTEDIPSLKIAAECVHVSIGDNIARGKICNILTERGIILETIVHPSAYISTSAQLGPGVFVGPRAVINNGAKIGDVCIVNTGAVVEHDNVVGFSVHIAPGAVTTGRVILEDYCFVGAGATIVPDVRVKTGALVRAGAVVTCDVDNAAQVNARSTPVNGH